MDAITQFVESFITYSVLVFIFLIGLVFAVAVVVYIMDRTQQSS